MVDASASPGPTGLTPGSKTRSLSPLQWIAALAAVVLAPGAIVNLATGLSAIGLPYSTIRIEAFVLDGVMRLAAAAPLYVDLRQHPAQLHVYAPLTYLVPALQSRLVGGSPEVLLAVGRTLSVGASLAVCAGLAAWTWKTCRSAAASALVFVLPLAFHDLALPHFFRLRPEAMALLLVAAALALVSSKPLAEGVPPTDRLVLSGLLAGCAFGFKQSFVAAPVAIFLFLVLGRRSLRAAVLFAASYATSVLAIVALSWLAWGPAFFDNVFAAMASNPIHLESSALPYARELLGEAPGLIAAGAIAFLLTLLAKGERGVVPWFYVVSLGWNFLSAGKAGAGTNYFAEFGLASVAILPVALAAAQRTRPLAWGLVALPLVANGVVSLSHGARLTQPIIPSLDLGPYLARYRTPDRKLITKEKIAVQLGATEGYDWYLLDLLVASGKARLEPWLEKIARHEYDLIVLDQTPRSRAEVAFFEAAQRAGYRVTLANPVVLELRPGPPGSAGPTVTPAVSAAPAPGSE